MAQRDLTIETPGVPESSAEPAPELSNAQKDALLAEQVASTQGLVGSSSAIDWSHLNQANAVKPEYTPVDDGLPDQLSVDPDVITAPVLTKQGWVLPTHDPRAGTGER